MEKSVKSAKSGGEECRGKGGSHEGIADSELVAPPALGANGLKPSSSPPALIGRGTLFFHGRHPALRLLN